MFFPQGLKRITKFKGAVAKTRLQQPLIKEKGDNMREVKITTDFIKLDQFLKYESIAGTGGEAKNIIIEGNIKVNGNIEKARGKKLRKGDVIEAFGEEIKLI